MTLRRSTDVFGLARSLSVKHASALGKPGAEGGSAARIELRVVGVFPQMHQAVLRSMDGLQYTVTRKTLGVQVHELREGQQLSCVVAQDVPKILEAKILA